MLDPETSRKNQEDQCLPRELRNIYLPLLQSDLKKIKLALSMRKKKKIRLSVLARIWTLNVQKNTHLSAVKAE